MSLKLHLSHSIFYPILTVLYFPRILRFHYGHEDSNTLADEDVTVITNEVWTKVYGTHDYKSKWFRYDL